jgi:GDP-D-mannose dehydratase
MEQKKTILVTGGAGYIGSHTCVELLEKGYGVVVLDNYSNSSKEVISKVEEITHKKITVYEADVRDKQTLKKLFELPYGLVASPIGEFSVMGSFFGLPYTVAEELKISVLQPESCASSNKIIAP